MTNFLHSHGDRWLWQSDNYLPIIHHSGWMGAFCWIGISIHGSQTGRALDTGRKLFLIILLIEARRQKGDHHENINKTYASRGQYNGRPFTFGPVSMWSMKINCRVNYCSIISVERFHSFSTDSVFLMALASLRRNRYQYRRCNLTKYIM